MSRILQADEQKVEEARQAHARFICTDDVSPKTFSDENVRFMDFINTCNPNLHGSFDFESLERNCLKLYAEEQQKVKELLSRHGGQISLSLDSPFHETWDTVDMFICLSAHFIDDDWKLRKGIIKYCRAFGDNYELPTDTILECLKEWEIDNKVFSATAGGFYNMVDVAKEEIQQKRKLPMNGELFHVQCSGDMISRMVEEAYHEIEQIIDKVQELSWSKSEPLWYLTSFKLGEALKLEAIGEFSSKLVRKEYDVPSKEEWGKVRSICRIADRIYDLVEGLFEAKRPTANLFLPHLQEIRAFLIQESGSTDEFVKVVVQKMLYIFDLYWKDMYVVLAIAAFVDPRYKLKFIEFCSSKLEDGHEDSKASSVLETIRKVYYGYVIENTQKEYLVSDSSSEEEEHEELLVKPAEKKRINLADRLTNILKEYSLSTESTDSQTQKSDLDLYLEEPILPWTENFCVLKWWKDNCSRFPHLSRMARDFLAIPLSIANSYEAYYTEPRKADKTLLSLKPELMNALKCTRSWKLNFLKG